MTPYYADDIEDMVETVDEHRIYRATMARDRQQLEEYARGMDMLGMMDTNVLGTRLYQFTQNCIDARRQQLNTKPKPHANTQPIHIQPAHAYHATSTVRSYQAPIEVEDNEPQYNFWNPLTTIIGIITYWHFCGVFGQKLAEWSGMSVDLDEVERLRKL